MAIVFGAIAAMVAEEMRQLKYDFGADHIWFADDIFGVDRSGSANSPPKSRGWMQQFRSRCNRAWT